MFQDEELTVGALLQNNGDLEKALVKLSKIGARVTGVTMGNKGCMAWNNGEIDIAPEAVYRGSYSYEREIAL